MDFAKKEGCYNLTLDAWADNAGAVRFYERLGMKVQKYVFEEIL
ncbi:GNAT family N-acetyltransferase [Leptotrichia sp. oral taxon 879]